MKANSRRTSRITKISKSNLVSHDCDMLRNCVLVMKFLSSCYLSDRRCKNGQDLIERNNLGEAEAENKGQNFLYRHSGDCIVL